MQKSGFLDNRDKYAGTWSPIFMKFCIMGSFLVYFQKMLSFWPFNLHRGHSGIPPLQLKKVYETYLCTKSTHCVKLEPQKMQWSLSFFNAVYFCSVFFWQLPLLINCCLYISFLLTLVLLVGCNFDMSLV